MSMVLLWSQGILPRYWPKLGSRCTLAVSFHAVLGRQGLIGQARMRLTEATNNDLVGGWAVVEPWYTYPSEKWWSERQLGWWQSQLNGKIKFMFQTTNQKRDLATKVVLEPAKLRVLAARTGMHPTRMAAKSWIWLSNAADGGRVTQLKLFGSKAAHALTSSFFVSEQPHVW